jgi:hypothetical protein
MSDTGWVRQVAGGEAFPEGSVRQPVRPAREEPAGAVGLCPTLARLHALRTCRCPKSGLIHCDV